MPFDRSQIESLLSAYLDGELTDAQRAEVEAFLAEDPDARQLLDDLRATVAGLKALPRARASDEFSDALRAHLERRALLGSESSRRTPRVSPPPPMGRRFAAAAVIALAVTAGYVTWSFTRQAPRPFDRYALKDTERLQREARREAPPDTSSPRGMAARSDESAEKVQPTVKTAPRYASRSEPDSVSPVPQTTSNRWSLAETADSRIIKTTTAGAAPHEQGDVLVVTAPKAEQRARLIATAPQTEHRDDLVATDLEADKSRALIGRLGTLPSAGPSALAGKPPSVALAPASAGHYGAATLPVLGPDVIAANAEARSPAGGYTLGQRSGPDVSNALNASSTASRKLDTVQIVGQRSGPSEQFLYDSATTQPTATRPTTTCPAASAPAPSASAPASTSAASAPRIPTPDP